MIHFVGHCEAKLFGLSPAERLTRQARTLDACIVAHASAVLDDNAMQWLKENHEVVLATEEGQPLAIVTDGDLSEAKAALSKGQPTFPVITPRAIGPRFIRKLRRKALPLAISLNEIPAHRAESLLFSSVYKGVTDLITKWVWPVPALYVTRLAAQLHVTPNVVTALGLLLTIGAGGLFFDGAIGLGLIAAWAMTFLDTVDGKLARVTATSSRIGNWLDHGTDVIHPPLWWACLAHGLALNNLDASDSIWIACGVILAAYVVARSIEASFHLAFGFNGYLLSAFDSKFRLVVARRNVLLLIMSFGLLIDAAVEAFLTCAAWSLVSTVVQASRFAHAWIRSRTGGLQHHLA